MTKNKIELTEKEVEQVREKVREVMCFHLSDLKMDLNIQNINLAVAMFIEGVWFIKKEIKNL